MASKTTKALVMKFTETVNNKVRQVKLTNPRADITDAEVQAFMELIVRLKSFYDLGPAPQIKSAHIIDQTTSNIGLTIE